MHAAEDAAADREPHYNERDKDDSQQKGEHRVPLVVYHPVKVASAIKASLKVAFLLDLAREQLAAANRGRLIVVAWSAH